MIYRCIIRRILILRNQTHIATQFSRLSKIKDDHIGCKLYHLSLVYCSKKLEDAEESLKKLQVKKVQEEINIWRNITVKEFAQKLNCEIGDLKFFLPHIHLTQKTEIDNVKLLKVLASKFNKKINLIKNPNEVEVKRVKPIFERQGPPKPENLVKRPPIVTIMGHVDHGKTTLLDSLRNTFVVKQEFGGITQHIGAFTVEVQNGRKIVFIDTPGHAAFTALRSRGAQVTDLVVLVIAADDGIMEQTVESIRIAERARVPIIVAVNKIDKPTAVTLEDIKQSLLHQGIQVEDCGGNVQLVPISALKKINLDLLMDVILLEADLLNLKGDPTGLVEGFVIESKFTSNGILATVIIKRGTLKKRNILVAGEAHARVCKLLDENGNEYKEAPPSTPVQILGWKELPTAGDEVLEVPTERIAVLLVRDRKKESMMKKQEEDMKIIRTKVFAHQEDHMKKKKQLAEVKEKLNWRDVKKYKYQTLLKNLSKEVEPDYTGPQLKLIVKGDVYGTLEVLMEILSTYEQHDECRMSIIDAGIGHVTMKDVETAELFNGEAEVLQNFTITREKKKVPVAGAKCMKGQLKRESLYRVIRKGEVIYEGKLEKLKHQKNEVNCIQKGVECGILLESFTGKFEPGDEIICYEMVDVPKPTSWDPGF